MDFAEITKKLNALGVDSETRPPNAPELPGIGEIPEDEDVVEIDVSNILKPRKEDTDIPRQDFPIWEERPEDRFELDPVDEDEIRRSLDSHPPDDQSYSPGKNRGPHYAPAWYCPAHFFGINGGIYMREDALISQMKEIALFVQPGVGAWHPHILRELRDASFLIYWFHEQFHHKIESLGFRLLVGGGIDRYRPYKRAVYQKTFGTDDCLEEALANCQSHDRFDEAAYKKVLSLPVIEATKEFLKMSFLTASPGYRRAQDFYDYPGRSSKSRRFKAELEILQTSVQEGRLAPVALKPDCWSIAPSMTRSLLNMRSSVYTVVARNSILPTLASPTKSTSSRTMIEALQSKYGYTLVPDAGKGSHSKLKRPDSPTIIVSHRKRMFPKELNQILKTLDPNAKINDLDTFLAGKYA